MSGGAGYVLSKKSVIKFAEEAYENKEHCTQWSASEDHQLGMCLERIGVIAGDTRDAKGLERFSPLPPADILHEPFDDWFFENIHHESDKVSFH